MSSTGTKTRTSVVIALLAAALVVSAASPHAGRAQSGSVPAALAGTWAHDGDPARGMRTVDAAFAASIASLPELLQGMARDRIRTSMQPPRRVLVSVEGSRVRVTLESESPRVIDGTLGSVARTSGVDSGTRVTPRLQGGWLELLYEGEDSQLRQLFSTEADGSRMHVDYTIVNPRLAGPVRYRLEYVHPSH